MEKMDFGRGTYNVAEVVYLAMTYTGSYNLSVWDEVSAALNLPQHVKVAVEDVSKAFECLTLLENRMCMAVVDSHYGTPDAFKEILVDICARFNNACNTFGVAPRELIKFWNDKLDVMRGGHLHTEMESVL